MGTFFERTVKESHPSALYLQQKRFCTDVAVSSRIHGNEISKNGNRNREPDSFYRETCTAHLQPLQHRRIKEHQ